MQCCPFWSARHPFRYGCLIPIPVRLHRANIAIFMHTMVAPTGVAARIERKIPDEAQTTDSTADARITPRKLLNRRMAESAGK